jgi:hypothetical protein
MGLTQLNATIASQRLTSLPKWLPCISCRGCRRALASLPPLLGPSVAPVVQDGAGPPAGFTPGPPPPAVVRPAPKGSARPLGALALATTWPAAPYIRRVKRGRRPAADARGEVIMALVTLTAACRCEPPGLCMMQSGGRPVCAPPCVRGKDTPRGAMRSRLPPPPLGPQRVNPPPVSGTHAGSQGRQRPRSRGIRSQFERSHRSLRNLKHSLHGRS